MADKQILCAFGIDLDAVGGWLGSYGGEDSPDDISRGLFAGEVGTLRLLKLFDNLGVQTTWFIPGHSIETFPEQTRKIVRVGDHWTKIDYSKPADHWMRALVRGQETDLIQIPANWYLDDLPPMMFIKKSPNSHGFVNPRDIEEMWRDQFDYVYREYDDAVFAMTIHPDVSGRPQVLLMLERLANYIQTHPGIRFCTFDEIADDFARRHPRQIS